MSAAPISFHFFSLVHPQLEFSYQSSRTLHPIERHVYLSPRFIFPLQLHISVVLVWCVANIRIILNPFLLNLVLSSFNVCSHPPTPLPDPRFAASYRLGVMNRVNGFYFYFSIVAINIRVRIWGGMKQNTGFHQQKVPRPPSSVPCGDREKGGWGGMVQKRCTSTIVICELISTC